MRRLFVTVGTTRFDALVDAVHAPDFQDAAAECGVEEIVLQHGHSPLPQSLPSPLRVPVRSFAFLSNTAEHVQSADVVIGHCGSGTALDVLRAPLAHLFSPCPPPSCRAAPHLIVVPNETLMHNHQLELGSELERGQHALLASPRTLPSALRALRSFAPRPLPAPDAARLGAALDALLCREQ